MASAEARRLQVLPLHNVYHRLEDKLHVLRVRRRGLQNVNRLVLVLA